MFSEDDGDISVRHAIIRLLTGNTVCFISVMSIPHLFIEPSSLRKAFCISTTIMAVLDPDNDSLSQLIPEGDKSRVSGYGLETYAAGNVYMLH